MELRKKYKYKVQTLHHANVYVQITIFFIFLLYYNDFWYYTEILNFTLICFSLQ